MGVESFSSNIPWSITTARRNFLIVAAACWRLMNFLLTSLTWNVRALAWLQLHFIREESRRNGTFKYFLSFYFIVCAGVALVVPNLVLVESGKVSFCVVCYRQEFPLLQESWTNFSRETYIERKPVACMCIHTNTSTPANPLPLQYIPTKVKNM